MELKEALNKLDVENDEHWTADGLPRVDVVCELAESEIKRGDITSIAPEFTRDTAREKAAEGKTDLVDGKEPEKSPPLNESPEDRGPVAIAHENGKLELVDAAYIEPEDDVVSMDRGEVIQSRELIERALAEFERQSTILARRREQAHNRLKELGALCMRLNQVLSRHFPKQKDNPVREYLETTKRSRAARAEAAKRFINSGTTQKDVIATLQTAAPIDRALNNKGKQKGRPIYPPKLPSAESTE